MLKFEKSGQVNKETGEMYITNKTYFITLFMMLFLLLIAHYIFWSSKLSFEFVMNKKLTYKTAIIITVILLIIYIILERFLVDLPFEAII